MEELTKLLEGYSIAEKRSSLYYLGRYIKQAETFEDYKKDMFEDDVESIPSEKVKALTLSMINVIEDIAKKKAFEFSTSEYIYWMNLIAEIEDNIDPLPNEIQIKNALENLNQFESLGSTSRNDQ